MPIYLTCPHCSHPAVVAGPERGRVRLCRQCGQPYYVPDERYRPPRVPAFSPTGLYARIRRTVGERPRVLRVA